jgi:outer membrane protein OmpA-like peptidoglycan-associated protein
MKHTTFILLAAACTLQAHASERPEVCDSVRSEWLQYNKVESHIVNQSAEGVIVSSLWKDNWFIGVSAGANAFIGKPLGCDDLFGRIKPTFTVTLGKWFTPSVGARLAYNGFAFNDCNRQTQDYQHLHADILWNILGSRYTKHDFVRWAIVPYAGVGLLHNRTNGSKPFAMSYGIQGQYRFSRHIAATLEIGNTTTFQEFDGYGTTGKLGDNLMHLSVGITANIGKVGWKRATSQSARYEEDEWSRSHRAIASYDGSVSTTNSKTAKSGYSGLNSLRARLASKSWNGNSPLPVDSLSDSNPVQNDSDYLALIRSGKKCIGAPVYFFFRLNTAELTEPSQTLNLDELASIARDYRLHVTIIGAADSATGTADINNTLGKARANFIANALKERGVPSSQITKRNQGGTNEYSPAEANRQTKVILHYN